MQDFDTTEASAGRLKLAVSSISVLLNNSESSLMQQEDRRSVCLHPVLFIL